MKPAFGVENPDFNLSPLTGMTRQHYIDCARYILERAFKHVRSFEQPIIFPTIPSSKSYPQPNDPPWRTRSPEFEALERTFNLDAPLIHVNPDIAAALNCAITISTIFTMHLHRAIPIACPCPMICPMQLTNSHANSAAGPRPCC